MPKCQYCCRDDVVFTINPRTSAPYTNCETCRPLAAAAVRESKKRSKEKIPVGMHWCNTHTKALPLTEFDKHPNGAPFKRCRSCILSHRDYSQEYQATDEGKDVRNAAKKARQHAVPTGMAWCAGNCNKPLPLSSFDIHDGVPRSRCVVCLPLHAAQTTAWKKTDAGQQARMRENERHAERLANDPNFAERCRVANVLSTCLAYVNDSPTLAKKTEFESPDELRKHFWNTRPESMKTWSWSYFWQVYGKLWDIDHLIPKEAYDHRIEDDVRRCHSRANMRACPCSENSSKGCRIIDSLCERVGKEHWPLWFGGKLLSASQKSRFYADHA